MAFFSPMFASNPAYVLSPATYKQTPLIRQENVLHRKWRDCAGLQDAGSQALTDRVTRKSTGKFHVVCEFDSHGSSSVRALRHEEQRHQTALHVWP